MHSRGARLARGWVVGVFATAIAALSHALGGGAVPSGLALLTGVVFAGLLGTFVAGRAPSLPRLTVAVIGGQAAFHLLFSYLGVPTSAAGSRSTTSQPTMAMHGSMDQVVVVTGHHHAVGAGMWIAHAVAALVTLVFLRFAERALWSLLTQIVGWAVRPFRTVRLLPLGSLRVAAVAVVPVLLSRLLDTALRRRGPPLSVAF